MLLTKNQAVSLPSPGLAESSFVLNARAGSAQLGRTGATFSCSLFVEKIKVRRNKINSKQKTEEVKILLKVDHNSP